MQARKELTLSVLEDVSRGLSTSGYPTRRLEVLKAPRGFTGYRLLADLSSLRCFDDKMLERFAGEIVALEIKPQLCMLVGLDLWGFRGMGAEGLKSQPAGLIETFARFQAGFLSSEDFHRFLSIFIDFHRFS